MLKKGGEKEGKRAPVSLIRGGRIVGGGREKPSEERTKRGWAVRQILKEKTTRKTRTSGLEKGEELKKRGGSQNKENPDERETGEKKRFTF